MVGEKIALKIGAKKLPFPSLTHYNHRHALIFNMNFNTFKGKPL